MTMTNTTGRDVEAVLGSLERVHHLSIQGTRGACACHAPALGIITGDVQINDNAMLAVVNFSAVVRTHAPNSHAHNQRSCDGFGAICVA